MPLEYVLALSAALFTIGGLGALLRRHLIVVSMCIELMLAAVVLALVAFSRQCADPTGHVFALLVIVVAGAQSVVGLAIVISSLRNRATLDTEAASTPRW